MKLSVKFNSAILVFSQRFSDFRWKKMEKKRFKVSVNCVRNYYLFISFWILPILIFDCLEWNFVFFFLGASVRGFFRRRRRYCFGRSFRRTLDNFGGETRV